MARYLLSSLTTHLKNCLTGSICRPIEKSLCVNTTVNQFNLYSLSSCKFSTGLFQSKLNGNSLLKLSSNLLVQPVRTVTKFTLWDGKRRTVPGVTDRFFRLHWGAWIRCKAGRNRKLWLKTKARKNRLSQHVFCTARQNRMLDTMVSKYWRRPKYYIEDPYAPYHTREYFPMTRTKPWRPEGVDYE